MTKVVIGSNISKIICPKSQIQYLPYRYKKNFFLFIDYRK